MNNGDDMEPNDDTIIDEQADRWVWWCRTRHYFAPAVKSNILARLQPKRGRAFDPDAFLDREMPFFNMAVHALCEQWIHEMDAACFLAVHWYGANIKAVAKEQQCARGTIYNRARRFSRQAQSLAIVIRKAHESFTSEKCSNLVEQNSAIVD
jgi:hypothetical protein